MSKKEVKTNAMRMLERQENLHIHMKHMNVMNLQTVRKWQISSDMSITMYIKHW